MSIVHSVGAGAAAPFALVACDMDGTLVRRDLSVSETSLQTIRELEERGVLFVPATGRSFHALPQGILDLPFLRYAILINGALVYDVRSDTALQRWDIPLDTGLALFAVFRELGLPLSCYMEERDIWMERQVLENLEDWIPSPYSREVIRRTRRPMDDLPGYAAGRGVPFQKIMTFFRDPGDQEAVLSRLRRDFPSLSVSSSSSLNAEITAAEADKGRALEYLMARLGLAREQVLAIGDQENDLTMLRAAGTGVVMGNASEKLRGLGFPVTEDREADGAALAMRRWALPPR